MITFEDSARYLIENHITTQEEVLIRGYMICKTNYINRDNIKSKSNLKKSNQK